MSNKNIFSNTYNFFRFWKVESNVSQVLSSDNILCNSVDTLGTINYDCGCELKKEELSANLVYDLYKRLFIDSIKDLEIKGISDLLIKNGVLFSYFFEFIKESSLFYNQNLKNENVGYDNKILDDSYYFKIYIKKDNKGNIIAINSYAVDETFIELKIANDIVKSRYSSLISIYHILSNYIISKTKDSEINNFVVFKKEGYNSLFDFNQSMGSSEYQDNQQLKIDYMKKQLDLINYALNDVTKNSLILVDSQDEI